MCEDGGKTQFFFTKICDSTKNFVNIAKTLAKAHQKHIFDAGFTYKDRFETSKKKQEIDVSIIEKVDTAGFFFLQ